MMKDDDFKLLKGFALGRTNGQTFAIVESLSRLKSRKTFHTKSCLLDYTCVYRNIIFSINIY